MARQPQVQPIDKEEVPPEVRARLDEIQDVMGLPWSPDNWRAYATYPEMLRLFWEQLRPATERDRFLRDALGIAERAYRDVSGWYQPEYTPRLAREDREGARPMHAHCRQAGGKRGVGALLPWRRLNVLGRPGERGIRSTLWIALKTTRRASAIAGSRC